MFERILIWLFLAQLLGKFVCFAVLIIAPQDSGAKLYAPSIFIALLVSNVIVFGLMGANEKRVRRLSLRRDDFGVYIWIDRRGTTCRSDGHPGREGGEWESEDRVRDNFDSGTDGDGSDGGGDGGD